MNKTAPIFEIKATSNVGEIEGYASTFGGDPDSYGDIIADGAFADSIAGWGAKGRLPAMLWQHNSDQPIGRWVEMSEDNHGLAVKGQINMKVPEAIRAYEHLKAGDIDGLSIGYRLEAYEVDEDEPGIWTLTRLDLREVSVVSTPANESAVVENVKAQKSKVIEIDNLIARVAAGERLTEREFEDLAKGTWQLSNSQAERAARVHLKGLGDLGKADKSSSEALLRALSQ